MKLIFFFFAHFFSIFSQLCSNSNNNNNNNPGLTRSGTGGSLERSSRRTTLSGNRKYKSRDLNVTVSRGIQTNLTKDPMEELPNNNIQTK